MAWWLPSILSALVIGRVLLPRAKWESLSVHVRRRIQQVSVLTMASCVALSVANYTDFGLMRYGTYLNEWAVFHYYLGSKYADELGYDTLYDAAFVAGRDSPEVARHLPESVRDLHTGMLIGAEEVIRRGPALRARFTPPRWRAFSRDVQWFASQLPPARFALVFSDHGYNATPIWSTVVGGLFTNHLDIREPGSRAILVSLDPLLLTTAFALIAWAFSRRVSALAFILLGTHYLMSWGHMKGMIARTDFVVCTIAAACLAEKGWFKSAGVALAWATSSRFFPVLFLAGPGVQALDGWMRNRHVSREWTAFFGGYLLTLTALIGLTFALHDGGAMWHGWIQKISLHYQMRTDWNIGYQVLVDAIWEFGVPRIIDPNLAYADETAHLTRTALLWIARAAVCVPALVFTRFMRPSDAILFGFVFVFMLVSAAYYYYIILLVPFVYFARRSDSLSGAIGVATLYIGGSMGYLLFSGYAPAARHIPMLQALHQAYPTYYGMTALTGLSVVWMLVIAAREARDHELRTR